MYIANTLHNTFVRSKSSDQYSTC